MNTILFKGTVCKLKDLPNNASAGEIFYSTTFLYTRK